jgi:hypothetical protein
MNATMIRATILLGLVLCLGAGCGDKGAPPSQPNTTSTPLTPATAPDPGDQVLVGAGDIASCWWMGDNHTGRLIDSIPGTDFTLGDNVYQDGSAEQYDKCYGPVWGNALGRTMPSAGNHDEKTDGGTPYYDYFGDHAGPRGKGYYSYDLGTWHIVVFNSNSKEKISAESEQIAWIRRDLEQHPYTTCILAYGHHPRFSSGERGVEARMKPLWDLLYEKGADVVLSGHEQYYERFKPQTRDGEVDEARGLRLFVVGTGGAPFYAIRTIAPNSEARSRTHGVLKMTLHRDSYDWEFIPVRGEKFTDSGHGVCSPVAPPSAAPALPVTSQPS